MGGHGTELTGPDFTKGIDAESLEVGGMQLGHANGEAVLLARLPDGFHAIGATCTHYSGPLAEGLLVGDTIRCPWHHACFSLRTGEAVRAPALNPVACWSVELEDGRVFVREKRDRDADAGAARGSYVDSEISDIVIVGAGAAGDAAAEMLRRKGFGGSITLIGRDDAAPYDRPNISKDYLAGSAPEEWLPLRTPDFYASHDVDLKLGVSVESIGADENLVRLSTGETLRFDRLLLATGSSPVRLPVSGSDLPHVHYLRTLADCRAIIRSADNAQNAVVVGASFIGMEAAASLRSRGLNVAVVAPEAHPFERVLGEEIGELIRSLHEGKGVDFHLQRTASKITDDHVVLSDGTRLDADLVVVGIGVRPETGLAEKAGLRVDNGVVVDEYLETSRRGIFAAGDIANWPDRVTNERRRVEHWVHAQRQGQVAARNILGAGEVFDMMPFFWTQHWDMPVAYVGHAKTWDDIEVSGSIADGEFVAAFKSDGKTLAVASVYRDVENLQAEVALEKNDQDTLEGLIARH